MNLESLLPKLPLIATWIDQTLAAQDKAARAVATLEQPQLGGEPDALPAEAELLMGQQAPQLRGACQLGLL